MGTYWESSRLRKVEAARYHIVWKFTVADGCIDNGMESLETSSVSELSWRTYLVSMRPMTHHGNS